MNVAETLKRITRTNVAEYIVRRVHQGRSIAQANIDLIRIDDKNFILKDFYHHNALVRALWGKRIIAREARILKRLQGIEGIPAFIGRIDQYCLVMEYIEGGRLPHRNQPPPSPRFFQRLKTLLGEMHKRGITHGDLRRKNILIASGDRPYLIDFAGAFRLKKRGNFIMRAIFRRLRKVDDLTALKLHYSYQPGTLTKAEKKRLENTPWYLRLGRFLKKKVYRPFKHATRSKYKRSKKSINVKIRKFPDISRKGEHTHGKDNYRKNSGKPFRKQ